MRIGTTLASALVLAGLVAGGCKGKAQQAAKPKPEETTSVVVKTAKPAAAAKKAVATIKPIRINAGSPAATTDEKGTVWLADTGFVGGKTVDRGAIEIGNTATPSIYRTEHWGMTAFSQALPKGKYVVNLHFAETYEKVTGPGMRVFTVNVEGTEMRDLDIAAAAGGVKRALVKSVPVTVEDGALDITFTRGKQSPAINGVEILPAE